MILELSKEKTNERLLDRQAAAFTASVQHVEAELSGQIRYLTQVCVWWEVLRVHPAVLPSLSLSLLGFWKPLAELWRALGSKHQVAQAGTTSNFTE